MYCALLLLLCGTCATGAQEPQDLHLMGLFPIGGSKFPVGEATLVATRLALQHINNRTDILPGYTLRLHANDSACDPGQGLNAMFTQFFTPPAKIAILGPGCSIVCQPCAEGSLAWNLNMMSQSCSSPALSDKKRYPRFFRTTYSEIMSNPARIALMEQFGWKKASILQESYELSTMQMDDLTERLLENNFTLITNEILVKEGLFQVQNLKRHDARIIFCSGYETTMRKAICKAYKENLYGSHIVWIMVNWYTEDWWQKSEECTPEEMMQVLDGALYLGNYHSNPNIEVSISGLNIVEFDELINKTFNYHPPFGSHLTTSAYDGAWAVALALNLTMGKMEALGINKTLNSVTYEDQSVHDLITESLHEIAFMGIKGFTEFDEHGDPSAKISLKQQQGENIQTVGYYISATATSKIGFIDWRNGGIKWRGGHPPKDGSITIVTQLRLNTVLYASMSSLAAIGILTALSFLGFNIKFRNKRIIKMSSPRINNLVLLGCILTYLTVFFQTPHLHLTKAFCVVRQFTFVCGFSLAFGSLFAKTWRVHIIMIQSMKTAKSKVIRDEKLALFVLVLILTNVCILTLWNTLDPPTSTIKNIIHEGTHNEPDVKYQYQRPVCQSKYEFHFTAALLALQGLLLIFGTFLAWETRKVKVAALNDSKYIGMCIYNVVVLAIMGVAIHFLVDSSVNISYGFMSSFIIAGTTLTQTIIFLPKVYEVYQTFGSVEPQTITATQSQTEN